MNKQHKVVSERNSNTNNEEFVSWATEATTNSLIWPLFYSINYLAALTSNHFFPSLTLTEKLMNSKN